MAHIIQSTGTAQKTQLQDLLTELSEFVPDCNAFTTRIFPDASGRFQLTATFETNADTAKDILEVLENSQLEQLDNNVSRC